MPGFFLHWQLWEKMTLVLAFAIVGVISLGICKNLVTRWRSRSYTTVGSSQDAVTPSMVEAQRPCNDEIPFGVRALESGVEVSGVWISRGNTPVTSCGGSPISASPSLTAETFPKLSLDDPAHLQKSESTLPAVRINRSGSRMETSLGRGRTSERSATAASRAHPPIAYRTGRNRPASLPASSSPLRYSITSDSEDCSSFMEHSSRRFSNSSADTHDRNGPSDPVSSQMSSNGSESHLSGLILPNTDDETQVVFHDATQGKDRVVDLQADLELLRSHRLSHVAETGQLTVRMRYPGGFIGGEYGGQDPVPELLISQDEHFFSEAQRVPAIVVREATTPELVVGSFPPIEPAARTSEMSVSKPQANDKRSRTRTTIPVQELSQETSQHSEVRAHRRNVPIRQVSSRGASAIREIFESSKVDLDTISRPSVSYNVAMSEQLGQIKNTFPTFSQDSLEEPAAVHLPKAFEHSRASRVLRKVNSSFQILQPGTLDPQLHDALNSSTVGRAEHDKRRHSRKLRKMRTPSRDRRRSNSIETAHGDDPHPRP